MTTMTLTIDDKSRELIEAFKIFASNFKGVSYEIEEDEIEREEEVLNSLKIAMKDIKSGEAIKNARPIKELFKEFSND